MSEAPAADAAAIVQNATELLQRSETAQAIELAKTALSRGIEAPLLLNLRAYWLEGQNRPVDALADLRRARELAPDDAMVANALGLCLAKLGRLDEALEAFQACVALAPEFGPGHYNCGWAFEDLGELDQAGLAFEKAARVGPTWPDPLGRLAALAARRGKWDAARSLAEQALALAPNHATAIIALASAELAAKSYAAAKATLAPLLDSTQITPRDRATAIGLLGDILDAEACYREAFAAYSDSNTLYGRIFAEQMAAPVEMPLSEYVGQLSAGFDGSGPWPKFERLATAGGEEPDRLIFLLGFPRSGTTLLEEVLACHPRAVTTGERDALAEIVREFLAGPADVMRLKLMDDATVARARTRYWVGLRKFGMAVDGRILIDKQPFNTVRLPLIARLFPEAKILFCLRDPRDVVLSCFRRRFVLNAANAEFLTLEGAAQLYDAVMRLAVAYRDTLPLSLIEIRNEDLVDDFDARIQAICDFVGIDWVDAFRDFAARSRDRQIGTPSAAQIVRGLGREGIGHWRNYEADLAPVLPLLKGWAARFGYE